MSYPPEPTTLVSRYTDGESLRLEGRVYSSALPIPMVSHSPTSSPSWDISSDSSAESGLIPDVPTTEPITEQIGFGSMYYDHQQHGHYHHSWEFPDPGHGRSAPPSILGLPADAPVVSSPRGDGSRVDLTRAFLVHGKDEISYTDEANTKLSNRIRRRCFNCKAIETSTWRRSVLTPGKLLCNKCGLFERTHAIPRPKKFPRRRAHSSKAVRPPSAHPDMRTPPESGFVNRHSKDTHSPSSLPITAHLLHALDPISGEIFPQHVPWSSPDAPDGTSVHGSRCYTSTEQSAMHHGTGQLPSTALHGAMWI